MKEINVLYEYVHGWELRLERMANYSEKSFRKEYGLTIRVSFSYPHQTLEEIGKNNYDFFISHIGKVTDDEPCPTKDAPLSVYRRAKDVKNISPKTITVAESEKFGTITGKEILDWFDDWSKPVLKGNGESLVHLLKRYGCITEVQELIELKKYGL